MKITTMKRLVCAMALLLCQPFATVNAQQGAGADSAVITPEEARIIAREAYVYGFPVVDNYRIQYTYFVDRDNPEFKASWNQIKNTPRVYTPEDKAVQAPNSDTPYSHAGLDLRAEPIVLTVPPMDENRYFSIQLIDAYTHNFAYIGSRATGTDGGSFIIAGPGWKGKKPEGIEAVIQSETYFVLAWYRTQLINAADLDNVKKVQSGYKVQALSKFMATPAPATPAQIDFPKPLSREKQKSSPEFFNLLNFALKFCPMHPSENELMARFAKLGIGSGGAYDAAKLSPELRNAVREGIADAWKLDFGNALKRVKAGTLTSADAFGTREFLENDYVARWVGAKIGIYANSEEEAIYPDYYDDADGQKLSGVNKYTVRFAPGRFPPVNAFWSLAMYELPSALLTPNPINRYLLNSPMLPGMNLDTVGGLTIYIQHKSPGKGRESNWLPAPAGPFRLQLRLYAPKAEALDGRWLRPGIKRVK
jgi:hypothetical protein